LDVPALFHLAPTLCVLVMVTLPDAPAEETVPESLSVLPALALDRPLSLIVDAVGEVGVAGPNSRTRSKVASAM
jgi:hypothetical protein